MSPSTRKGVVVLGAPRSGTTLLRRLLNAHPSIACPGETNVLSASAHFIRGERIAGGTDVGVLSGLEFAGFPIDETIARLRSFVFGFLEDYARLQNKPRWAEKTAFNLFYAEEIERLCGDEVQYVCIQRHGLDVAVSLNDLCQKNGGYLTELHEYVRRYPSVYEAFAHTWVDLTLRLRELAARNNSVIIKYEDLVANTPGTMSTIFSYLGEDPAVDVAAALRDNTGVGLGDWKTYSRTEVTSDSIGRWKKLPKQTISMMGEICNSTLQEAGYDAVAATTPPTGGQRSYELGLMLGALNRKSQ